MKNQTCPLCGHDAQFSVTTNPNGKHFTCSHCTEFWIDGYAEKYISDVPEVARSEMKHKLSEQAQKTASGHLYVIREPKHSEITGDGHGVARTSLITEWVNLSGHS